jgi:hypothetical protein
MKKLNFKTIGVQKQMQQPPEGKEAEVVTLSQIEQKISDIKNTKILGYNKLSLLLFSFIKNTFNYY